MLLHVGVVLTGASAAVGSSQNHGPAPVAGTLPVYTYDNIGPPQTWNVMAPSGDATDRYIQDELTQFMFTQPAGQGNVTYTLDPASFAMYQGHMTDTTSAANTDETAYQPLSLNDAMLSQLAEYLPGNQEMMMSTELLQQLGNASHLTEVSASEFGLIFNSHDAAITVDQLLHEPSVNPPNT